MTDDQLDVMSDSLEAQRKARMSTLLITKVRKDAIIPQYKTAGAAGLDLHACLDDAVTLVPKERKLIPTGLSMAIPVGYEGQVRPRSGMALNLGVGCLNSPGTIDWDYRGEIQVLLINLGQENVVIRPNDRIAQLVICPIMRAELVEVDQLDDTLRGVGGFGSTGHSG
jgi:dUTP pyrophosphatase